MNISTPICNKCGKFLYPTGTTQDICTCPPEPLGNLGWICPVCGRGNSPMTTTCPCNPLPFVPTVTWCYAPQQGGTING